MMVGEPWRNRSVSAFSVLLAEPSWEISSSFALANRICRLEYCTCFMYKASIVRDRICEFSC